MKQEPFNGDDEDSVDEIFSKEEEHSTPDNSQPDPTTESDERQLNMIDKLVGIITQNQITFRWLSVPMYA